MRIIDLSQPLHTGMPVFPGDPEVSIHPALTVEADGVAVARLDLGSHSGTHLDAPSHSVHGGMTVDELPLEWLIGEAAVFRIADTRPEEELSLERLDRTLPEALPIIALVSTGWAKHYGTDAATVHPHIGTELGTQLWRAGVRVLGVDTLSPDSTTTAMAGGGLPLHDFWLGSGGVIVENLRGLDELPERVEVSLLPLRLSGVDGSPIRAIARMP